MLCQARNAEQPFAAAISAGNRVKVARERPQLEAALSQAAGSGQKWSRADFATLCAIGRGGGVLDAGSGSLRWRMAVKTVGSGCLAIYRCLLQVLPLALHPSESLDLH